MNLPTTWSFLVMQNPNIPCFTVPSPTHAQDCRPCKGELHQTRRKKNGLIALYLKDAIGILDAELELLNLRIQHPKEFPKPIVSNWKSPVYLANGVTHTAIMEIINGLCYLNQLKTINGQPSNFSDVVRVFENGFNFKFSKKYQTEEYVIKRKPFKITEQLEKMIVAIKEESKRKGYL